MSKTPQETTDDKIDLAVLTQKVDDVKQTVGKIEVKLESNYATKEWVQAEYGQTKSLVNAIFIAFGLALVGGLATFVIRGGLSK